jgi:hypothetical protein
MCNYCNKHKNVSEFYTKDGWINAAAVMDDPATFCICLGGRGTGRTFGILKEVLERDLKFSQDCAVDDIPTARDILREMYARLDTIEDV